MSDGAAVPAVSMLSDFNVDAAPGDAFSSVSDELDASPADALGELTLLYFLCFTFIIVPSR